MRAVFFFSPHHLRFMERAGFFSFPSTIFGFLGKSFHIQSKRLTLTWRRSLSHLDTPYRVRRRLAQRLVRVTRHVLQRRQAVGRPNHLQNHTRLPPGF